MNRRAAIAALVAAVPGLASAGESPFLTMTGAADLTIRQTPLRVAAIFHADGCIEIPLDGWSGWRVTFGGESIDISAAELFEALKPPAEVPKWNPHATITDRPAGMKP